MRNTYPLGRIAGIRIGLHRWIPWLVGGIGLFATLNGGPAYGAMIVVVISTGFSLVLLHELGHSLVARHFDVQVKDITLWPLGGVAWMEDIPEDPKIEGLIAIAGPLVNLVLAACALPLLLVPGLNAVAGLFIWVNLMLGLFNLVPAFPMDGGRVLRALLALRHDWLTATEKAVRFGKTVALVGTVIAVLNGFFLVPLLAVYVWGMGQRELLAVRAKKLGNSSPFGAFAEAARRAQEEYSRRAQAGGTPFGFEGGPGMEGAADFDSGPEASREVPGGTGKGFTDEEIARLEGFRGRLPRDWRDED